VRLLRAALPGTVIVRVGSDQFIVAVTGAPVHEVTAAQLEALRKEFTTPSESDCMTARSRVRMGAVEVGPFAEIYRGMKLAHDAYYECRK
jgi:GGDEF domain-containing protein